MLVFKDHPPTAFPHWEGNGILYHLFAYESSKKRLVPSIIITDFTYAARRPATHPLNPACHACCAGGSPAFAPARLVRDRVGPPIPPPPKIPSEPVVQDSNDLSSMGLNVSPDALAVRSGPEEQGEDDDGKNRNHIELVALITHSNCPSTQRDESHFPFSR